MTEPKQAGPRDQASQCFMCTQYRPNGCLACRTHRLIEDIRTGMYDKMGLEQNRTEWEERAIEAEKKVKILEAQLKECVKASADFAGRNVTLHCENLRLKREMEKEDIWKNY